MSTHDYSIMTTPDYVESSLPIGKLANRHAAIHALRDYQKKLSANTKRRQVADLTLFAKYLGLFGIQVTAQRLMDDITTWEGMTHGLLEGFIRYQEQEGYAFGSINVRLSTVKRYCTVAAKADVIAPADHGLIKTVQGYRHKEGRNLDKERAVTRKGVKKAESIAVSKEQAAQLKHTQPDTPQGRRDALLMCLLLDHGLRCGEIAALILKNVNLIEETLTFYREKVDMEQVHLFTKDTRIALRRYLECVQLSPEEHLLRGSRRSLAGDRLQGRMSERAITARVNELGERIGITCLSAHDGRHAWATFAIKAGTDVKALQDAGGWKSPVMPLRYAASGKIANAGVKLD
jgi:integrase